MSDRFNKKPTHGVKFVEGQPTVIFDTVCTKHRMRWLDDESVHRQLLSVWKKSELWLVGRYVIMPDHIHLFAWATENSIEYENWVRYWKSQFTKLHQATEHRWQTDHWETRIRNENAYEEKWNYVKANPVRAELVADENDWPYQGEVFKMNW